MSSSQITIRCGRCGSEQFRLPNSPPQPDDVIECTGCGATGRYRDIQADAVRLAKAHMERAVRDAFKGVKGFKLR